MIDYQKIRRDLHQIPEIGLEEYKTHAYLMRIIDELTAGLDFVEIRTWRTGISLSKGVHLLRRLAGGQILTVCRLLRRQGLPLLVNMRDVCMPVGMICT